MPRGHDDDDVDYDDKHDDDVDTDDDHDSDLGDIIAKYKTCHLFL